MILTSLVKEFKIQIKTDLNVVKFSRIWTRIRLVLTFNKTKNQV